MADRDYMEDMRTVAMSGVKEIAAKFRTPDADFTPALIYVDGGGKPTVAGIIGEGGEREKDRAARMIEAQLRRYRAQAAALMLSVWRAEPPPGTTEAEAMNLRASRMSNRREVLWLQVTDGARYEVWEADLLRHDRLPPTVGGWRKIENAEGSKGRFMLLEIFRRAVGVRA